MYVLHIGWVNTLETPTCCFLASEGRVWDTGDVPLGRWWGPFGVCTSRCCAHPDHHSFWFLKLRVPRSLGHTKCGRCMQYTLGLLSRFFLILDLGQDSMIVFNSSEECVRNTCLTGLEGGARAATCEPFSLFNGRWGCQNKTRLFFLVYFFVVYME